MFDVSTPLATIDAGTDFLNTFNDFSSGASYGEFVYSDVDDGLRRELALSAAAVTDLNAAIAGGGNGEFGIGGTVLTLDGTPATDGSTNEFIFGLSQVEPVPTLNLQTAPIPVPASLALWLTGCYGWCYRRRCGVA